MARRLPSLIALVAVLLLAFPTAALAAYSAAIAAPENAVVNGSTEVRVRVERGVGDLGITGLKLRPAGGGEWVTVECASNCRRSDRSQVYAFDLDPRSGAPFGDQPLPNGSFTLDAVVSRDLGGSDREVGQLTLALRVPGSAVGGLAATVEGGDVRLAWSRAPEPDILRYRVERCEGACEADGDWVPVEDVGPGASSHTHAPGPGEHSFRVVTVRDAGDDGDGTFETVSSPTTAEVARPTPSESPSPSPSPSPSDRDDDGDGDPDEDGATDGAGGAADRGPRPGAVPDLEATPRRDGPQVRSGRAPAVALGRGGSGIPDLPAIGDVFSSELDYSGEVPDLTAPETADAEVVLSAPGRSSGSFLGRLTDPNRIAVPIAGGLLMTAVGLHLWRWLRVPMS